MTYLLDLCRDICDSAELAYKLFWFNRKWRMALHRYGKVTATFKHKVETETKKL